jgi:hypothetical protein
MGGALGITVAGLLLDNASNRIAAQLPAQNAADLMTRVWGSIGSADVLEPAAGTVTQSIQQTLGTGIINGWGTALVAAVIGLVATTLLRNKRQTPAGGSGRVDLVEWGRRWE